MKRVYLVVAVAALAVHGRALVPNPTPDACEYQMLARSLARGDGFTLPVRVRHDVPGPVWHDARAERAPILPLALAAFAWADEQGPSVSWRLQCVNALVGALDAVLVASVAFAAARSRRIALAAGVLAAWSPPLVDTSCKLLAEPLGLALILVALRASAAPAASGAALGLARLARPEALAASVLLALGRRRREVLIAVAGFALVTIVALALGAGAPQGFLFRVANFRDVMFGDREPAPSVWAFVSSNPGLVARLVGENALDLGHWALRFGHAVPVLGLVALARRDRIAVTAFTLALGAACVWSTRDHTRFLVAPLALLAIPATIEARRLLGPRGLGVFLALALVPLALEHARWTRGIERSRSPTVWDVPPEVAARLRALGPREAFAAVSPWSLALASGRDGLLLPNGLAPERLRALLDAHPEVKVVVLRPVPHDRDTVEPWRYEADLAAISSRERIGATSLLWLSAAASRGSPSSR